MDKRHVSHNSTGSVKYSRRTQRPHTQRNITESSSQMNWTLLSPIHRYNPQTKPISSLDISLSKNQYSNSKAYADIIANRKNSRKRKEDDRYYRNMDHSRMMVFKNLQQFELDIQSQKAKINKVQSSIKAYSVATFKGVNSLINTHQISVLLRDMSVFTLFQGYDGLLAATTLKKIYNLKLIQYFQKKKQTYKQDSFETAEQSIRYAVAKSQAELQSIQRESADNSGSSLLSLVVHGDIVFGANCGPGQIICLTIGGNLLSLAQPHTTDNQAQIERIVRGGGRLYQTIVNIPYKQNMIINGPIRVHPSGLIYTRTLGKSSSKSKQSKTIQNSSYQKGVICIPQIKYVPVSEVRWLVVISSNIVQTVKKNRIRDIIEQQMAKRSQIYEVSQAAEHACKRVLLEAVESGCTASLSVLLLVINDDRPFSQQLHIKKESRVKIDTEVKQPEKTLSHKPRSLKYVGNRVNFVQEC